MLNQQTLNQIKKLAIAIDWQQSFGGRSKGNKHLFRVNKIAGYLAKKESAPLNIILAAAWLHDIGLTQGDDTNPNKIKKTVYQVLQTINLSNEERQLIADCILAHEGTTKAKSLEAKIIYDADAIDKIGPLGLIRHTWKLTNLKMINAKKIDAKLAAAIFKHVKWREKKLQTTSGKQLTKKLDYKITPEELLTIVSTAAALAIRGIITEKIIIALKPKLSKKLYQKLSSQLNLNYLK